MAKRRPNNDGGYGIRTVHGKERHYRTLTVAGQPRRYFYGETEEEATAKYDEARRRMRAGLPIKDSKRTVGEWTTYWIENVMDDDENRASTNERDAGMMRKHVVRNPLGEISLDALKVSDIRAWKKGLMASGLTADSSRNKAFQILRKVLEAAKADRLLAENPLTQVEAPSIEEKEMHALEASEAKRLYAALAGSQFLPVAMLVGFTGLRRGEAIALRWQDVDFERQEIKVCQTASDRYGIGPVKTKKSRRKIPMSPLVERILRAQRKKQREQRVAARNVWVETGLVFNTDEGKVLGSRNTLRAITSAAKRAKLENVNVHALRHTAATALIESGVADKAVADLMGHTDTRTTAKYTHPSDDYKRQSMKALGEWVDVSGLDDDDEGPAEVSGPRLIDVRT